MTTITQQNKNLSMTKQRIKNVFDGCANNMVQGKEPNVMGEMIRRGYSVKSAKAMKVTTTKTWQELLNSNFPDSRIQKLLNKALDEYELSEKIEDKRSFLGLIDMILKLKDKYPAGKVKIGAYDERERVLGETYEKEENEPKGDSPPSAGILP